MIEIEYEEILELYLQLAELWREWGGGVERLVLYSVKGKLFCWWFVSFTRPPAPALSHNRECAGTERMFVCLR